MKTTTNRQKNIRDYKTNGVQFAYLLDCITVTLYDETRGDYEADDQSDRARVQFVVDRFNAEYNYEYNRKQYPNTANRIAQYFRGLPSGVNIAYWNDEIEQIGRAWGYCKTKAKASEFVNNWWDMMGLRLVQLANYFEIEINK